MATITPLYNFNGQTYELMQQSPYVYSGTNDSIRQLGGEGQDAGRISYMGGTYRPYTGSVGQQNTQQPRVQTPYVPNAFTQGQLGQFNNGQRGNFENNPAYQQYVAKMNNMYGVSPVGAAGDVLAGQTAFPAGGKTGPTNTGSNT